MKCPYCGDEMIRGYLMSSREAYRCSSCKKILIDYANR